MQHISLSSTHIHTQIYIQKERKQEQKQNKKKLHYAFTTKDQDSRASANVAHSYSCKQQHHALPIMAYFFHDMQLHTIIGSNSKASSNKHNQSSYYSHLHSHKPIYIYISFNF